MCRLKRGQDHLDHRASAWAHGGLLDLQIPLQIGVRSTRKCCLHLWAVSGGEAFGGD